MHYRRLGRSGLKVSEISLGSWVTFGSQIDEAAAAGFGARIPCGPPGDGEVDHESDHGHPGGADVRRERQDRPGSSSGGVEGPKLCLQGIQAADPARRIVVTGDFNAFEFSDGYVDVVGQIAGVAAGMAEYLEVDPTIIRIAWILSAFIGGFTILHGVLLFGLMVCYLTSTAERWRWTAELTAWIK